MAKVKLLIPLKDRINTTSLKLQLVGKDGSTLPAAIFLSGITATFNPPLVPFRFVLRGRTVGGFPFKRVSREIVQAKSILLRTMYTRNYLTIRQGKKTSAMFAIHNNGVGEVFDINVFSTLSGINHTLSRSRMTVRPYSRSYIRVVFTVDPKVSSGQSTAILVKAKGLSSGIKAQLVANFLVVSGKTK